MKKKGILIIVSGFSGAGKGTLVNELRKRHPDSYALSISATTRQPRAGEEDGREYFFRTREEFEAMIQADALFEHATYVNNYYGTPKAYVEEQLNAGKDVILEIEIQGALKVKAKFPDALLLFVSTPTAAILKERLVGRGTEDMDTIRARLKRAVQEAEGIENYDYFVINDELEACAEEVHAVVTSEHSRVSRNINLINHMREELSAFSEGEQL